MTTALFRLICAPAVLAVAAGCGGTAKPRAVPDVSGKRLDVAEETLESANLRYEVIGGGALGVIVRSHWQVCRQRPSPGRRSSFVELVVARSCPAGSRPRLVPALIGLRLDAAEDELAERGIEGYVESDEHVIIRTNWTVCDQYPSAGQRADTAYLYVQHFSCDGDDDD